MNLANFTASVVAGFVPDLSHHGASSRIESSTTLRSYDAKIKEYGCLREFSKSQGYPLPQEPKITLSDVLLSDLSSSSLASELLEVPPLTVAAQIYTDSYDQAAHSNDELLKDWNQAGRPDEFPQINGRQLLSIGIGLDENSSLDKGFASKFHISYLATLEDAVIRKQAEKSVVSIFPFASGKRTGYRYEVNPLNLPTLSRTFNEGYDCWPIGVRMLLGAWMLGDIIRYSPQLLLPDFASDIGNLQIACEFFIVNSLHLFPLLCLQTLMNEQIIFSAPNYLL